MIKHGKVRGSTQPQAIEFTDTKVFVASNITPYSEYNEDIDKTLEGYEYTYTEYTKDEYILHLNEELEAQILETQMALCDIYESLGE